MTVKLLSEQHLEFLSLKEAVQARMSLHLSKCHIVGNHMWRLICTLEPMRLWYIGAMRLWYLSHLRINPLNVHAGIFSGVRVLKFCLSLHLKGVKKVRSTLYHIISNHLKRKVC